MADPRDIMNALEQRVAKLEEERDTYRRRMVRAEGEAALRFSQIAQIAQALGLEYVPLPTDETEWPLPDLCRHRARALRALYVQKIEE